MSSKATEIAKNLPALEHPDGSPIRALVVDDEEMLKELVSMGLEMIGWDVQSRLPAIGAPMCSCWIL